MPRISKIRIVGCKYDNFKKKHLDSFFDLTKGDEPDHILFTMKNGSGKGVIMQLISQILLPGTRWGKNNGNKVISMFYNQYRQFIPYTFHVVLEWKLDTIPERWLTTGICVTASRLNTLDEEDEERVGLRYFLYTMEHNQNSKYNINNLPLFDTSRKKPLDYDTFNDFINDNKQHFRKFSKTDSSRSNSEYYQYLKSNGLYRGEWEILKLINRSEGGLNEYFSSASDNKAIFDKMIIPAITENIYSDSEDYRHALKDIFRSNITITQKLPILLSREADYHDLLVLLEPVINDSDIGIRYYERFNRLIDDGNNLLQAFLNYSNFLEQELKNSELDLKKAEKEREELEFQQDNLKYADSNRRLQLMTAEKLELKQEENKLVERITVLKEQIKKYRINQLIFPYDDNSRELTIKKKERDNLKSALDIKQLEEEIGLLEDEIKIKWPKLSEKCQQISIDHYAYLNYLEQNQEELKTKLSKLRDKMQRLAVNIKTFENKQQEYLNWKKELAGKYNPLQLEVPAVLLEELEANQEKIERDLSDNKQESLDTKAEVDKLLKDIMGKEYRQSTLDDQIKELELKYQCRQKEEKELYEKIVTVLKLDSYEEVHSRSCLNKQQEKIKELLIDKKDRRLALQQELWENNIDLSLNNQDYWLANKDILSLKEEIAKLGLKVEIGSSFIKRLSQSEREEILENYPLLPFALIILQEKDWEIIKENINPDILLHAATPIYIRSKMNQTHLTAYQTVRGKAYQFSLNDQEFFDWQNNLSQKEGKLRQSISSVDKSIEELTELNNHIIQEFKKDSSLQINNKLQELKDKANNNLNELRELKEKMEEKKQLLNTLEEDGEELSNNLNSITEEIATIKEFIAVADKLLKQEKEIEQERQMLATFRKQGQVIEDEIEIMRQKYIDETLEYRDWSRQLQKKLSQLKEVIKDISFVEEKSTELSKLTSPKYKTIDQEAIFDLLNKRNVLNSSIEQQNQELALVNNDIRHIEKQIEEKEKGLKALDNNWSEYRIEDSSATLIDNSLQNTRDTLRKEEERLRKISSKSDNLSGKIETIEEDIQEMFNKIKEKYKRAALLWDDIDLAEKSLRLGKEIEENSIYLNNINDIIQNLIEKKYKFRGICSELKVYSQLNEGRGKVNQILLNEVKENPDKKLDQWKNRYQEISTQLENHTRESQLHLDNFLSNIKTTLSDTALQSRILESLEGIRVDNYRDNYESFISMQEHFKKEINSLSNDKKKAEEAREQWANRAAKQLIKIVESLKEMVAGMVYHNENDYSFPLLRLQGSENLPREEEEVKHQLKEYFLECIKKIEKSKLDINNLSDRELDKFMSTETIFAQALRGKYPVLEVYKMSEKNEFLYARPRDYNYSTWEAINKGQGYDPEGSGGQTLSINTFVIMMLMNYRKKSLANDNPWTVLVLDNPFGKASAEHILDPVFTIADSLNFQLITFAAPEIIKTEISERFPIFWALKIATEGDEQKQGSVTGCVIHGGRIRY